MTLPKAKLTGTGVWLTAPVGCSLPEFWLMRNGTTESEFWLPTSISRPDGSMLNPRGIAPCVEVQPIRRTPQLDQMVSGAGGVPLGALYSDHVRARRTRRLPRP